MSAPQCIKRRGRLPGVINDVIGSACSQGDAEKSFFPTTGHHNFPVLVTGKCELIPIFLNLVTRREACDLKLVGVIQVSQLDDCESIIEFKGIEGRPNLDGILLTEVDSIDSHARALICHSIVCRNGVL